MSYKEVKLVMVPYEVKSLDEVGHKNLTIIDGKLHIVTDTIKDDLIQGVCVDPYFVSEEDKVEEGDLCYDKILNKIAGTCVEVGESSLMIKNPDIRISINSYEKAQINKIVIVPEQIGLVKIPPDFPPEFKSTTIKNFQQILNNDGVCYLEWEQCGNNFDEDTECMQNCYKDCPHNISRFKLIDNKVIIRLEI